MSNKNKVSPKAETVKKVENLNEINLSELSARASEIVANNPKGVKGKKITLYIYPEDIAKGVNDAIGKNWRNNRRREIKSLRQSIAFAVAGNKIEEVKQIVSEFRKVYATYYTMQDLSLGSVTSSNDAKERSEIQYLLDVVKKFS